MITPLALCCRLSCITTTMFLQIGRKRSGYPWLAK